MPSRGLWRPMVYNRDYEIMVWKGSAPFLACHATSEGGLRVSIYLNNAATSWPKPACVAQAMSDFLCAGGANLGRGSASARDMGTMGLVLECRERLAKLFGGYNDGSPVLVTFTANITESLNLVLKGFLKPGMRVVTTSMEHNAVIRPLRHLEAEGVELEIVPCNRQGFLDPDDLAKALAAKKADLVVICHCSNVCGSVQDLASIASVCREAGVPLVVDTAQTAGHLRINASELGLAALCFTGHKGLMGPQGIGGIIWEPEFAKACTPLVEGGTGSFSHVETQPVAMPDRFESGTQNLPGIAGLNAALKWLEEKGIDSVRAQEERVGARLLEGLKELPGATVYGLQDMVDGRRLPVFAVNFEGVDNGLLAADLSDGGVETRPGLQCSPWGHQTLGCFPQGALRLSPGYFTTDQDVDEALKVIRACLPIRCRA